MFDSLPATCATPTRRGKAMSFATAVHAAAFATLAASSLWATEALDPPQAPVVFHDTRKLDCHDGKPLVIIAKLSAAPPVTPKLKASPKPTPMPAVVQPVSPVVTEPVTTTDKVDEIPTGEVDELAGLGIGDPNGDPTGDQDGDPAGIIGGGGGDAGGTDLSGTGDARALKVGGDVKAPVLIHQVMPRYPEIAKQIKLQGLVIVEAIINEAGVVEEMRVLRGHQLLEGAAREAMAGWRFEPGRLNGRPVRVYFQLTVNFTLR